MKIEAFGLSMEWKGWPSFSTPMPRSGGTSWPIVQEPFPGAWQRNQSIASTDAMTNPIVWACVTRIAYDISKLWLKLLELDEQGIGTETDSAAFSPVIRKPNHYSTRIKFYQYWIISKLLRGNTYVLKERDDRGVVVKMHILDSSRVQVLIAPDGSVFYQLSHDDLAQIDESVVIPAREIIHDVMVPLYHQLIGVSPMYAALQAALQGLRIQEQSTKLFENGIQPSGILSSKQLISAAQAERLEKYYYANHAGPQNVGKIMVVGDGLEYKQMTQNAQEAQLIEQLRWADEKIPPVFGVPGCIVGIGDWPPYTDIQSMMLQYYLQALQEPMENMEILLREGLELPTSPRRLDVEFALETLLRMDSKTQIENATKSISGGLSTPNEERAKLGMRPVPGGDQIYLQQQNYSLEALARRDEAAPAPPTTPVGGPPARQPSDEEDKQWQERAFDLEYQKAMTA